MNDKNKNLVLRIVTALLALPILLYLIYLGGYPVACLFAFAAGATAYEYYSITLGKLSVPGWAGVVGAAAMPLLPVSIPQHAGDLAFWWIVTFFVFFFAWHLIKDASKEAPTRIAHHVTGMVYGTSGMMALAFISMRPSAGWWTFITMFCTWMNDTCAYFAGRALGRHKLYVEVSPNKTWEGFFGGMVGSTVGLFVIGHWFFTELTWVDCLILGIGSGILGPVGDLCESMLKRSYGVKDSGKTLPGHGGVLDRIDALQFNAILVFVYLQFARGFV
ncbi:MAG: phosphatidate cytidylyltransferase [Myxococcota bacterium]|nr:phosphatidate cytidylyltransferase [Myxococcota bacterium]